jgi:hypothetical protein
MILLAAALVFCGVTASQVSAAELITAEEAALPNPPDAAMTMRGISRGPSIEQVSPPENKSVKSPVALVIKLSARNNEKIDKDSVKVTYVKSRPIDLTARLKPFVSDGGIDMKDAEIPPGAHLIRVDVKDSQGRTSTALLKLTVEGK